MSWSFDHLERGVWPDRGFYGEVLNVNTLRGRMAGKPLGNGWRGCYFGSRADAKARKEANSFNHNYGATFLCETCCAQQPFVKANKMMCYKDFSDDAPYRLTTITHEWYLRHFQPSPYSQISGWHLPPVLKIIDCLFLIFFDCV
jgi:hypothetical protein